MAKLVALCKRRGIVFQSSEIYGGVGSTYDYGPYGVEIKNNISRLWWDEMTRNHENIVGLDSAVILHPQVWEASGHLKNFSDPMIECKNCKQRIRADEFVKECYKKLMDRFEIISGAFNDNELIKPSDLSEESPERQVLEKILALAEFQQFSGIKTPSEDADELIIEYVLKSYNQCTNCGAKDTLTPPRQFNLMFQTNIGSTGEPGSEVYLRPETCQGIFLDWKIVQESARLKVPFGIAQIGKAFRNEITTGNFIFRTREFTQMEMQYFVKPGETSEALNEWKEKRWNFYLSLAIDPEKLRWLQHPQDKLAHYAKEAWDIEYEFPFGWGEVEGIHDRGDFDLKAHQESSGKDMTYFDDQTRERFHPHIVETSAGLNRMMLTVLWDAYREDEQAGEERIYLALDPKIAPIKAAVFPLVKKGGLPEIAESIYKDLRKRWRVFYDFQGSIGKRYRRMDEIGTPFGITVDFDTLEDNTVTVRFRDSLEQVRIDKDQVGNYIAEKLGDV
ncbi:glycine--tRNA ligase [bacterium]|nr:glycine--tRNA ligase [bacterium]